MTRCDYSSALKSQARSNSTIMCCTCTCEQQQKKVICQIMQTEPHSHVSHTITWVLRLRCFLLRLAWTEASPCISQIYQLLLSRLLYCSWWRWMMMTAIWAWVHVHTDQNKIRSVSHGGKTSACNVNTVYGREDRLRRKNVKLQSGSFRR